MTRVVLLNVEGVVHGGKKCIIRETRTSLDRLWVQVSDLVKKINSFLPSVVRFNVGQ